MFHVRVWQQPAHHCFGSGCAAELGRWAMNRTMTPNDWKQSGHLYLWRYNDPSKKFSGWHMTTDGEGARSLVSLVDLFLHSDTDAKRTLRLTAPTQTELRVPNFKKKADPAERLVLEFVAKEESSWSLSAEGKSCTLRIGHSHLLSLRAG